MNDFKKMSEITEQVFNEEKKMTTFTTEDREAVIRDREKLEQMYMEIRQAMQQFDDALRNTFEKENESDQFNYVGFDYSCSSATGDLL